MSKVVRSIIALVLLASAAHAQAPPPYAQRNASEQGAGGALAEPVAPPPSYAQRNDTEQARLLQLPPTRTRSYQAEQGYQAERGYQAEQASREFDGKVQPVSHVQATGSEADYTPLPLRTSKSPQRLAQESTNNTSGKRATATVIGSLSVVLAAFFVLAWLSRKTAPKGLAPLPGEVFESLGRAPLSARQQMQLIRLGNKLVLLSVTATGAKTLTEITDVDEVNRLSALCQQGRSGSISDTFRQVLSQYAEEPAPGGFVGDATLSQVDVANRTARRERRSGGNRA